jgi:peptidoglycan/LPS O-acetylase OafA/YrhL
VLGPLVSAQPATDYLSAPGTYEYLLNGLLYTGFPRLPGVFLGHPCPALVNGSLWTLPVEFALYLAVMMAGRGGVLTRRGILIGLMVLAVLVVGDVASGLTVFQGTIPLDRALKLCFYFGAGAGLYLYRARVPLRLPLVLFAAAFFAASAAGILPGFIQFVTLPYLVIYVAETPYLKAGDFARYGDFSYGMYLYGFVIEQALEPFFRGATWPVFFTVSYGASILCGILSWHVIEKRALRWKR